MGTRRAAAHAEPTVRGRVRFPRSARRLSGSLETTAVDNAAMDETYDVVVVGGGAAGLSAALALGRSRRSVLVVDAGEPRNAPAGHVHDYLGREGVPPGELLASGRAEVAQYGVHVESAVVTTVEQAEAGFAVTLRDGRCVHGRRLLVATGTVDLLPDLPGLAEGWGRDVLHCPYCHGWEVRDQPLGVLATGPFAVHQTLLFRQLTPDLTLFVHTAPPPTSDEREQLAARGVSVVEGLVSGWEGGRVRLASGELVARAALVVSPTMVARADFLAPLGLQATPVELGGHVVGTRVAADATGATAVPGVWVAGNVADVQAQVIGSAAAGLLAGAAVNADLVAEDTHLAVERARVLGEAAWEERYGSHASAIWSGQPNAVLVAEAADLPPGRALDVGSGEGADALWLAARGWNVEGVDISTVALARAAAEADARGLLVRWVHADLLRDPPAPGAYDLVTAHFLHLPQPERGSLYARLAAAVAPGGTLLVAAHHPSDMHTTMHRPRLPDMFFTAEELAADLDPGSWDVEVAEARPRTTTDPHGAEITIRDTVLRARRRPG